MLVISVYATEFICPCWTGTERYVIVYNSLMLYYQFKFNRFQICVSDNKNNKNDYSNNVVNILKFKFRRQPLNISLCLINTSASGHYTLMAILLVCPRLWSDLTFRLLEAACTPSLYPEVHMMWYHECISGYGLGSIYCGILCIWRRLTTW